MSVNHRQLTTFRSIARLAPSVIFFGNFAVTFLKFHNNYLKISQSVFQNFFTIFLILLYIDVWRGVWRFTHAKLTPLTSHPIARVRHNGAILLKDYQQVHSTENFKLF